MSINTEISRISNAKTAIASAITAKGVSVPSTTKLDGMAALIANIPTGGLPATITPGDTPIVFASTGIGGTSGIGVYQLKVSMTIPKAGTYRIKFWGIMTDSSTSAKVQLYKNGSAVSGAVIQRTVTAKQYSGDMTLAAGDVLDLRGSGDTVYDYTTGAYGYVSVWAGSLMGCANV